MYVTFGDTRDEYATFGDTRDGELAAWPPSLSLRSVKTRSICMTIFKTSHHVEKYLRARSGKKTSTYRKRTVISRMKHQSAEAMAQNNSLRQQQQTISLLFEGEVFTITTTTTIFSKQCISSWAGVGGGKSRVWEGGEQVKEVIKT